jgi:hypothetical protein
MPVCNFLIQIATRVGGFYRTPFLERHPKTSLSRETSTSISNPIDFLPISHIEILDFVNIFTINDRDHGADVSPETSFTQWKHQHQDDGNENVFLLGSN